MPKLRIFMKKEKRIGNYWTNKQTKKKQTNKQTQAKTNRQRTKTVK